MSTPVTSLILLSSGICFLCLAQDVNECEFNPCKNNGVCIATLDGYRCECDDAYGGTNCDTVNILQQRQKRQKPTPSNMCLSNPCINGGVCIDGLIGYTCSCPGGYSGSECTIELDECASDPCMAGGICTDTVNRFDCSCPPGYTGPMCEIDIDECASDPCMNVGTCTDNVNAYNCSCRGGYSGTHCETDINECDSNPCDNDGTCTDGVNRYSCTCHGGYGDGNCEADINECSSFPCYEDSECFDGPNLYVCTCVDGFTGTDCETEINECDSSPCKNGAVCIDDFLLYRCECTGGHTGTQCETEINECLSQPCRNDGVCIDNLDGYICRCDGYSGTNCEKFINLCNCHPCQNGASCFPALNHYTCFCAEGFGGPHCESPIKVCETKTIGRRLSWQTTVTTETEYTVVDISNPLPTAGILTTVVFFAGNYDGVRPLSVGIYRKLGRSCNMQLIQQVNFTNVVPGFHQIVLTMEQRIPFEAGDMYGFTSSEKGVVGYYQASISFYSRDYCVGETLFDVGDTIELKSSDNIEYQFRVGYINAHCSTEEEAKCTLKTVGNEIVKGSDVIDPERKGIIVDLKNRFPTYGFVNTVEVFAGHDLGTKRLHIGIYRRIANKTCEFKLFRQVSNLIFHSGYNKIELIGVTDWWNRLEVEPGDYIGFSWPEHAVVNRSKAISDSNHQYCMGRMESFDSLGKSMKLEVMRFYRDYSIKVSFVPTSCYVPTSSNDAYPGTTRRTLIGTTSNKLSHDSGSFDELGAKAQEAPLNNEVVLTLAVFFGIIGLFIVVCVIILVVCRKKIFKTNVELISVQPNHAPASASAPANSLATATE